MDADGLLTLEVHEKLLHDRRRLALVALGRHLALDDFEYFGIVDDPRLRHVWLVAEHPLVFGEGTFGTHLHYF